MTIDELLDQAKTRANLKSDYALAKVLGVSTGIVANWRKEKRHPSNEEAIKLATLAGLDERQVIAEIEYRTANTEKKKEFWKHYLKSHGFVSTITLCVIGLSLLAAPLPSRSEVLHMGDYANKNQKIYIMRNLSLIASAMTCNH